MSSILESHHWPNSSQGLDVVDKIEFFIVCSATAINSVGFRKLKPHQAHYTVLKTFFSPLKLYKPMTSYVLANI